MLLINFQVLSLLGNVSVRTWFVAINEDEKVENWIDWLLGMKTTAELDRAAMLAMGSVAHGLPSCPLSVLSRLYPTLEKYVE